MLRMIVTDLDDTLLRRDKTVSEYSNSVLNKCRDKGLKVVFATARSAQAVNALNIAFAPDMLICYGGGAVFEGKRVIYRFDIPADISYSLTNECLRDPDIIVIHATNETAAHTDRADLNDVALTPHYRYHDFTQDDGISYLKISVTSNSPEAVERIAAKYPMLDMLRYTGEDLYRFANRNAVKWNAIRAVAENYGIEADGIAAFGDDVNDVEMIQNCGVGVAVENAITEVKAAAKHICGSCDDDGVAKWITENIL